jgi:nucleoside-diphosphate-sugar epimerase
MKYVMDQDLKQIWAYTSRDLVKLDGKTLFLTGCTGVFGVWLLSTLLFAKQRGINTGKLFVLSRNPSDFIKKYPELVSGLEITWICAEICDFAFPNVEIDYCIHGASTSATETFLGIPNIEKFITITKGSQRILELVKTRQIKSILYLSSGAVFGGDLLSPPAEFDERYVPRINHLDTVFTLGHAKRSAESMFFTARERHPQTIINIARLFTFVGPHMPTEVHYAIGNFVKSASEGITIKLNSDGSAIRSYMYMSDAIIWLIKCLTLNVNVNFPLHVGSEQEISIKQLADIVGSIGKCEVHSFDDHNNLSSPAPRRYIPSTKLTKDTLGVEELTDLETAIKNTLQWLSTV